MRDYSGDPFADLIFPGVEDEPGQDLAVVRTTHQAGPTALPIGHFVAQAVAETATRHEHGTQGLQTSLTTLNPHLGEMFSPGKVCVLAAGSGVAKTTILSQLVVEFAEASVPVFHASMEDDGADNAKRMLANISDGSVGQIRAGFRDTDGNKQDIPAGFDEAAAALSSLPITMVNQALSIVGLAFEVAAWRQGWADTDQTGVVVIDQLGHLLADDPDLFAAKFPNAQRPPAFGARDDKRWEWQVAALKELARVFSVTVIVAHQLNEVRDEVGKPTLGSIRDSKGIVHKANTVLAAWRPTRLPNPDAGPGEPNTLPNESGRMWLLGLKFREGATFELEVAWHGAHQRIADVDREQGEARPHAPQLTAAAKQGMAALADLRERWDEHVTASRVAVSEARELPAPPVPLTAIGRLGAKWALPAKAAPAAPPPRPPSRAPDLF